DKFACFCTAVIGDMSGIVSGTATRLLVLQVTNFLGESSGSTLELMISVLLTAAVAAITAGGKALGTGLAMSSSTSIMNFTGRVISVMETKLKRKILPFDKEKENGK